MALPIFICEDDPKQRENLEHIINNHIVAKNYDASLAFSTGSPIALLGYLEDHPMQEVVALYFLDVDLHHEINGIVLASKIKKHDPSGKFVFVTTHTELSYLTFRYRVDAMDYIIKNSTDDVAERVQECIDTVYNHHRNAALEGEYFQIASAEGFWNAPIDDIIFFETCHKPHNLILHLRNGRIEFRGSLSEVEQTLPNFFRPHKSYLINLKKVSGFNKAKNVIEMQNGKTVPITAKKVKSFLECINTTAKTCQKHKSR
jgi:two-component system response regulator AgrA